MCICQGKHTPIFTLSYIELIYALHPFILTAILSFYHLISMERYTHIGRYNKMVNRVCLSRQELKV